MLRGGGALRSSKLRLRLARKEYHDSRECSDAAYQLLRDPST